MREPTKDACAGTSIALLVVTAFVFVLLKISGIVAWSWWWVLLPCWICPALLAATLLIGIPIALARSILPIDDQTYDEEGKPE